MAKHGLFNVFTRKQVEEYETMKKLGLSTKNSFDLIKKASKDTFKDITDQFSKEIENAEFFGKSVKEVAGYFVDDLNPALKEMIDNNPEMTMEELSSALEDIKESAKEAGTGAEFLETAFNTLLNIRISMAISGLVALLCRICTS